MRSLAAPVFALSPLLVHTALAGPITPPPGPIASTPGVEPRIAINATNTPGDANCIYRITEPGSYYLEGNVDGVSGKQGVVIESSSVVIDLNGFALRGVTGSFSGIICDATAKSVVIRNGTISGWGGSGVDIETGGGDQHILEGVVATQNGGSGIAVGASAILVRCIAAHSGGYGIYAGPNGTLLDCKASANGWGIVCDEGAYLSRCTSSDNANAGFLTETGTTLSGCVAHNNASNGIAASGNTSRILDCVAYANGSHGVSIAEHGLISGSTSRGNSGCGFISSAGSVTVARCLAAENRTHGISVGADSLVTDNQCVGNGVEGDGSGIRVGADDCRVEGNSCIDNDRGVQVLGARNLIIRNSCSGNTTVNWEIAVGNALAPIIHAATNTTAVFGNAHSSSLGTTDPLANFTH